MITVVMLHGNNDMQTIPDVPVLLPSPPTSGDGASSSPSPLALVLTILIGLVAALIIVALAGAAMGNVMLFVSGFVAALILAVAALALSLMVVDDIYNS